MNAVSCYDFTLPKNDEWPDHMAVIDKQLKDWCKHYVFQLEQSDTGYIHWQGRVSLIKKRRENELKGKWMVGGHFSVTSTAASKTFSYVMKADTRIDGPWRDDEMEEQPEMTMQLELFQRNPLDPWMQTVVDMSQQFCMRTINVIYDTRGNNGKSMLCEYMEYHKKAIEIPAFRMMEDIMQCVMSQKPSKCYLIDMPRGLKKDKLGEFYSGIECLKNGMAYDKRYQFRKKRFSRPQIFVFTNTMPVLDLLSPDRWKIWEISQEKSLQALRCNTVEETFLL